jgi:hypothetical protein
MMHIQILYMFHAIDILVLLNSDSLSFFFFFLEQNSLLNFFIYNIHVLLQYAVIKVFRKNEL